jgi:hypothetical protein
VGLKPRASDFPAQLATAFDVVLPALCDDPTFADSYGNDLDRLRRVAGRSRSLLEFLNTFIGGARGMVIPDEYERFLKEDTYMYAALAIARHLALDDSRDRRGAWSIDDGEAHGRLGDLIVDGDLTLGAQSMLVVLGDLTVEGDLHAGAWYSRVAVGGTLRFRAGLCEGELIAGSAIEAESLYLRGNDVSCRAPRLVATDLLVEDKYNRFVEIDAVDHVDTRYGPAGDPRPLRSKILGRLGLTE